MDRSRFAFVMLLAAAAGAAACDAGHEETEAATAMAHELPASDGPGFIAADVRFMQGMISHHAQAIVMAEMAPSHGVGERLLKLAEKIDISQRDEIALMERWLAERGQTVPDSVHHDMVMMPGMITREQLAELDAARGEPFERLFLAYMIQHHQGALAMVEALLTSPLAAQDSDIFRFITDVQADQSAEIDAMWGLLEAYPGSDSR